MKNPFEAIGPAWRRVRTLCVLSVMLGLTWFLLESLVFRTGFYYRSLVEPRSNAGSSVMSVRLARRVATSAPATVLVFGDSRVGQGFSSSIADAAAPNLNFINVAVPGSTPRTWYYLLREMVRKQVPFEVVVIGIVYQPMVEGDWDNWSLDPSFMAPLVGLQDGQSFPHGFSDEETRRRAQQTIWLPTLLMQKDIQSMLLSPRERRKHLKGKTWWLENIHNYRSSADTMPVLTFDHEHEVVDWGAATQAQQQFVESHLAVLKRGFSEDNARHARYWIGKIQALAQQQGARVVLYPEPRGPYTAILPTPRAVAPAIQSLETLPGVTLLPMDLLADLEQPAYFFDALHANEPGQKITSERVAHAVAALYQNGGVVQP